MSRTVPLNNCPLPNLPHHLACHCIIFYILQSQARLGKDYRQHFDNSSSWGTSYLLSIYIVPHFTVFTCIQPHTDLWHSLWVQRAQNVHSGNPKFVCGLQTWHGKMYNKTFSLFLLIFLFVLFTISTTFCRELFYILITQFHGICSVDCSQP